LRIYQELSYQEIAVAMQLSVDTVKSHLHQGRQQLRKKLAEYYHER
jgi:DNA-directed RNA polymerase specialized sigma24 family protein